MTQQFFKEFWIVFLLYLDGHVQLNPKVMPNMSKNQLLFCLNITVLFQNISIGLYSKYKNNSKVLNG